ncbi:MAG TPA: glycosyltransferase family 2 protein [Dehalococcoidia bacterium]
MATPTVAVVLVNYNGGAFIDEFAASLERVTYPQQRLFIVDNASTDGSQSKLPLLFPSACIIENPKNLGLAPALNQALQRCLDGQTNYVLLLNTDTTHNPDFLDKLVAVADDHTIVVPKILSHFDRDKINTHAGDFDWLRGVFKHTYDGRIDGPWTAARREVETASFCCMLIPALAFHDVGGMDERLAMYYEDTDFAARARAMGYRILFEPSARIYHREGGSGGGKESPFKHYYATRNRPYLIKKHRGGLEYAAFTAYFLTTRIAHMALYGLRGNFPQLRAQWLAVRDYYSGRMGMTYDPVGLMKAVGWKSS